MEPLWRRIGRSRFEAQPAGIFSLRRRRSQTRCFRPGQHFTKLTD